MNLLAPVRGHTLLELLELRAELRRKVVLTTGSLRDVRAEVRSWNRHRWAQQLAGHPVPEDLACVWAEIAERENEIAEQLALLRSAHAAIGVEIEAALRTRSLAS